MKHLDPKNDIVFKKIFGKNKHLLMSLLNEGIEYISSEQISETLDLKR